MKFNFGGLCHLFIGLVKSLNLGSVKGHTILLWVSWELITALPPGSFQWFTQKC